MLRLAVEHTIPVTARGSGTGLSGAAIPVAGGIVVSFERMAEVVEVDTDNHVAVVQPGVTLQELDTVLAAHGLIYPVFPGEYSASLGGNVATNAGGMRAVKYGVTRHQVLGLEAVLPGGEVIRTGGRYVKSSTGYDLTQLIIGSEGTLALVTEATLRVYPRPANTATLLAPFRSLDEVMTAVPKVITSGVDPLILEYIDKGTLAAMSARAGMDLGISDEVKDTALAYLVVMLEDHHADRLDEDVQSVAELMSTLGAIDVYVLPPASGTQLIQAREKAFWLAKAAGAHDIIDVVVPRASIATFMAEVTALAERTGTLIAGCGHAGDGNVHLSVFQPDTEVRSATLSELFSIGLSLGGAISGEHGIGTAKRSYFLDLEDPAKVALMRRIKAAFDPTGIMNPATLLGDGGKETA
ncbi:MAG: FAD-linked oxidase C-terminal domain-containing protein [Acidimicrobiales bacterium]|nr:FAD-linked oxidase C-terminal domain-containing protein [Acidimicrobiales bacterium]